MHARRALSPNTDTFHTLRVEYRSQQTLRLCVDGTVVAETAAPSSIAPRTEPLPELWLGQSPKGPFVGRLAELRVFPAVDSNAGDSNTAALLDLTLAPDDPHFAFDHSGHGYVGLVRYAADQAGRGLAFGGRGGVQVTRTPPPPRTDDGGRTGGARLLELLRFVRRAPPYDEITAESADVIVFERGSVRMQLRRSIVDGPYFHPNRADADDLREGVALTLGALAAANRWCAERDCRLIVTLLPEKESIYHDAPEARPDWHRQLVQAFCERRDLECRDVTPALRAAANRQLYFESDGHWNAAGHEVVARFLAEQLREQ